MLAQKCKLICQSHRRRRGGGDERREEEEEGLREGGREGGKKVLIGRWPTIPIEISHSQAGYCPEAGGFALETTPVAIFGM